MVLALFDSNPQELGFAVPSRKLGLEARFCISPFANGLNRGTGRFTPSFSGVPQSAPLHFGLSPWQACESGLQWVMANTAVLGLTVGSRSGRCSSSMLSLCRSSGCATTSAEEIALAQGPCCHRSGRGALLSTVVRRRDPNEICLGRV